MLGHQRVIRGLLYKWISRNNIHKRYRSYYIYIYIKGYQRVIRGLSEGDKKVIRGLSKGYLRSDFVPDSSQF